MAHGKHRRAKKWPPLSEKKTKLQREQAMFIEQEHMVHDGDATEQVFNLMACIHPAQCTCESDYPNWAPGLR